jgi:5-formyltetrahydrofolate cyclo-ligase
MRENIQASKAALRRRIRARLNTLTPARRASESAAARSRLEAQAVWAEAQAVLVYAALPGEPDIWPLVEAALAAGKTVALPRFDAAANRYGAGRIRNFNSDLQTGRFGIREPAGHCAAVPLNRLDLALVPGVAFDLHGRRLGRGKGFYDQLLALVRGTTCGVAFDEQIVAELPVEPHDVQLNCILTPTRWIEP